MSELILKKKYFLNPQFNKNDSVIIYTILFSLITRYFVWYNNKEKHQWTGGNDTVAERLTLKKLDKKIDDSIARLDKKIDDSIARLDKKIDDLGARLDAKIDKLAETVNAFIVEQRKFNQYVLDVFERNNLK